MTYKEQMEHMCKGALDNTLKPEGDVVQFLWDVNCYLSKNNLRVEEAIAKVIEDPKLQGNPLPETFGEWKNLVDNFGFLGRMVSVPIVLFP